MSEADDLRCVNITMNSVRKNKIMDLTQQLKEANNKIKSLEKTIERLNKSMQEKDEYIKSIEYINNERPTTLLKD